MFTHAYKMQAIFPNENIFTGQNMFLAIKG
jgi:hypothetical protein